MGYILIGAVVGMFVTFKVIAERMKSPYKLYIVVGEKASGKTAYLAKLCEIYNKKTVRQVYSNCGVGFELPYEYWTQEYPADSLLLIDEIGLIHDNRNFKSFDAACNEFYKYQRKNKLIIVATSQNMDIDKKIRILTDYICLVRRFLCFGVVKRYQHKIVLADDPEKGGKRLTDTEKYAGIEKIFFLPSTFDLFDTLKKAKNIGRKEGE